MKVAETVEKLKKETKALRKEVIIIKSLLKQQSHIVQTLLEQTYVNKPKSLTKSSKHKYFPLITQEDLDKFENLVNPSNRDEIIQEARLCIRPYGLSRALKNIIGHKLAGAYNLDGTYDKKRLFNYQNLLDILFRAVEEDGLKYDQFLKNMRFALHNLKKKNARSRWSLSQLKSEVQKMDDDEGETEDDNDNDDDDECTEEYLEQEIENL